MAPSTVPLIASSAGMNQETPLTGETVLTSQTTQVGSLENAQWEQTLKKTVTIQKTSESTTQFEVRSLLLLLSGHNSLR